jgi:hypothetical protein
MGKLENVGKHSQSWVGTEGASRQIANGDEQKYSNFIGKLSQRLPHNAIARSLPPPIKRF